MYIYGKIKKFHTKYVNININKITIKHTMLNVFFLFLCKNIPPRCIKISEKPILIEFKYLSEDKKYLMKGYINQTECDILCTKKVLLR